jgi:glyoxylase-like metal-dependent hydrolase (beta-lactamase superfamily II)
VPKDIADIQRGKLTYPVAGIPQTGEAIEVGPGVLWLRMPLGGPLGHINCWALEDGDGWTLVDTGMGHAETLAAWETVLAGPLGGRPVKRVVVTHLHPDHVGAAGWLTRRFGVELWMTRLEYLTCRVMAADTCREAPAEGVAFYRAAGWTEAELDAYRKRFGRFGSMLAPLPDGFRRISDGDVLIIGGREWRVVVGSGHSPEHASLWSPELGLIITGDQVLPRISSNVGVHPTEPEADPLHDWLTSLARVKSIVPDDVLALPAHNEPFHGLHARIDQLIEGHEKALARLRAALDEPKRAVDVFPLLFRRTVDGSLLGFATGESLAHLNYLRARGEAERSRDETGVDWWRAVGAQA